METINNQTVALVANHLNKTNSKWAVGGSLLLKQRDIINQVNDMDIIVHRDGVNQILGELVKLGEERVVTPLDPYATTYYYEFNILDLSMDVMGEFKIRHEDGVYVLPFEEQQIEFYDVEGVDVPFCTLESWYILYQLIPGREKKVAMIENYFKLNGVKHPSILENAINNALPKRVIERIQPLIEKVV
ncbi:nucleotidyltransferase family protein [Filobacillus milosensis]|uniref:hypothetical protein n=1 Tax=Filobacillus milosensis TaxID=94137 RepID=UPI0010695F2A|nr:hypothetical protein [Filobacillus milosensis]